MGCYYRPDKYVYGSSFTGEYLRHITIPSKVKSPLFHVITYATHVEQTLTRVTTTSLAVQYETSQFIDSTFTFMHGWFIYGSQFVTLSGDQNEVFESLVLHSLLLTANFRKSKRQNIFFSFSTIYFYGLIVVYTEKLFQFGEGRKNIVSY